MLDTADRPHQRRLHRILLIFSAHEVTCLFSHNKNIKMSKSKTFISLQVILRFLPNLPNSRLTLVKDGRKQNMPVRSFKVSSKPSKWWLDSSNILQKLSVENNFVYVNHDNINPRPHCNYGSIHLNISGSKI